MKKGVIKKAKLNSAIYFRKQKKIERTFWHIYNLVWKYLKEKKLTQIQLFLSQVMGYKYL